jgi:hypothetical protein
MKDPFYEPFFNNLEGSSSSADNNNNNSSNAGGMATSFSLQNLTNATTNEVLQQLFPVANATSESSTTVVDLLEQQQNSIHDFMKQQPKKHKKSTMTKKYIKKQQRKSMSHQHINHNLIRDFSANLNLGAPIPGSSQTWFDPSVYPLWPNYICLYLEYSLPYDPSVGIYSNIELFNMLTF